MQKVKSEIICLLNDFCFAHSLVLGFQQDINSVCNKFRRFKTV